MTEIDLLSLIEPPDQIWDLQNSQDGRELLAMFDEINARYPDFFGAVASMAGVAMPTRSNDGSSVSQAENEGKRLFAIELLAVLKVAQTPIEGTPDDEN